MPLDELLATLERQASEEVEAVLSQAGERARVLLDRARARLDAEHRRALDEHRARRRADDERRLTAAARNASRRVYEARRGLLDRVFEAARKHLVGWQSLESVPPEALDALARSLPYLDDSEAVLFAPPAWRSAIEDRLGGEVRLLAPEQEEGPVLALASTDRRRTVDLSPAARIEHCRPELSIALLREMEAPPWSPTAET